MVNRYDRQERVEGWNQNKLLNANVAIVGSGALGTVTALQLACLGIGRMDIFDFDTVEGHNLNRQFLYFDCVGKNKAVSLVAKLRYINSGIQINAFDVKLTKDNIKCMDGYDIIFDCTDNWEVRRLLNKFVLAHEIKFVHGGMRGFEGQVQCINSAIKDTPCLECMPRPDDDKPATVCEVDPAIVTTSFLIAAMMAQEGVKMLLFPDKVYYGMIIYNGFTDTVKKMDLKKNPKCKVCGVKR